MTWTTINIFIKENYSKTAKMKYATNKIDVYHIDEVWSLDILDLEDYGYEII